jgi:hypothetical protein
MSLYITPTYHAGGARYGGSMFPKKRAKRPLTAYDAFLNHCPPLRTKPPWKFYTSMS